MRTYVTLFCFIVALLPGTTWAQAGQEIEIEEVSPDDIVTGDFSWDDVEELPLPTDEELGVQVDGEDYIPQPDFPDEVIEEVEVEDIPLSEPVAAPIEAPAAPEVAQPMVPDQAPQQAAPEQIEPEISEPMDIEIVSGEDEMQEPLPVETGAVRQAAASTGVMRLGAQMGPDIHTIQRGDTLWAVCNQFFGDPYLWPKLWAMNQYITNPHLIYPRDELRFFMGTATSAPRLEIATQQEMETIEFGEAAATMPEVAVVDEPPAPVVAEISKAPTQVVQQETQAKLEGAIEVKNYTFISAKKLKGAGWISHSGEEKQMLSYGDLIYMKFKDKSSVKVGDRFHIIETVKKVKHPKKFFGSLGYFVQMKGQVKVVRFAKNVVVGFIEDSWMASSRDDRLVPFESAIRQVVPREAGVDIEGTIFESATLNYMIGQRDLAFVDRGTKDGLKEGDRLRVVRRGDGIQGLDKKLPDVAIAEMTVVETLDMHSVVFVNWANKTVEIGDRVRTRVD